MKRVFVLLTLVTIVIWLAHGASSNDKKKPTVSTAVPSAAVAPPQSDGPCDGGCDPDGSLELACFYAGGYWDPSTCYCNFSCDPTGQYEAYCFDIGGSWDPATCYCQPPACDPSPEFITYDSGPYDCSYCDEGYYYGCNCDDRIYTRYCQDGSVYSERTETAQACAPPTAPPNVCDWSDGGGGGGGGGGDCWDDPSCSCEYYDECCDWDYCYTF
jgi:hypothetical protein